jgi:hypothetical protein
VRRVLEHCEGQSDEDAAAEDEAAAAEDEAEVEATTDIPMWPPVCAHRIPFTRLMTASSRR